MAMTACFAGPVFNVLMGLGLGFLRLCSMHSCLSEHRMHLTAQTAHVSLLLCAGGGCPTWP